MRLLILLRPCMHQPVMRGSGRIVTLFVVAILCALAIDCATPKGATVADKRTDVLRMRDETLADLYREEPEVRSRLRAASAYGVFSDIDDELN